MGLSTSSAFAFSTVGVSPNLRTKLYPKLLNELWPAFIHGMDADPYTIMKGEGNVISWRLPGAIPVTTATPYLLTEGVTPANITRSMTEVRTSTVNLGAWLPITDVAEAQSFDDFMQIDTKNLGKFNGQVLDVYTRDIINQGTQVIYAGGAANRAALTGTSVFTDAEINRAVTILENNNVPKFPDGTYHAIVPSRCKYDLRRTDAWKLTGYYSDKERIATGNVDQIFGMKFMYTSLNTYYPLAAASGTVDVEAILVYGPEAFGRPKIDELSLAFINKPVGSAGADDPLNQRGSRGTKLNTGAAILDNRRVVRIECAATVTR